MAFLARATHLYPVTPNDGRARVVAGTPLYVAYA
jgi:hypothetical protein